jgi:hypothetical protein
MTRRRTLVATLLAAIACLLAVAPVAAQSLDPRNATPLRAGENRGTVDCMVGPQYWSFRYHKGAAKISVHFGSMGLFGNATTATIQVTLRSAAGQVFKSVPLTSRGPVASLDLPGTFTGPGVATVELAANGTCLVRAGGDYTIELDGDAFDFAGATQPAANPARIAGTYAVMVCAPDFDCQGSLAIRFAPDGTVRTTDGHAGVWRLFDPDAQIYSVVIGADRWSLKLVPGRGLFNANDLSVVVFQAVRPG